MQRSLERKVRAAKKQYLAEDAAGADTTEAALKLKAAGTRFAQFFRDAGFELDSARIGVNGFGHSAANRAAWVNRKHLANPQNFGKIKAITGACITNPDSKAASSHAERYYGLVRSMTTDAARVAQNTGFSEADVRRIKQYLFLDEHDLSEGVYRRFDSDFSIAQSWQRLIDGNPLRMILHCSSMKC